MEKKNFHQQPDFDEEYAAKYRMYERIYRDQCSCPMPQPGEMYDLWSVGRQQTHDGLTISKNLGRFTCLVEYTFRYVFVLDNGDRQEVTKNDLKAGLIIAKPVTSACNFQLIPVKVAG